MTKGRFLMLLIVAAAVLATAGAAADTFEVHVISQTNRYITLGWTAQPGYGYFFSADGQIVSRTYDSSRTSVRFRTGASYYDVDVVTKGANGHYQVGAPPPPPSGPSAPTNLHYTDRTQTTVTIAWDSVTGATNYNVFRDGTKIGQGAGSNGGYSDSWADSGLTCGTKYTYGVNAENTNGTSSTTTLDVSTLDCSAPPPQPACSDGIDNDGDGLIDYPADPGCTSATDTDETDPAPPPPPPTGQTMITPSQFQSMATSGATISNVHVTGSVSVGATNVAVSNCTIDGEIDFNPGAGGSSIQNCAVMGFNVFGADGIQILNNQFDGKGQNNQNILWDQPSGNSPSNWVIRGNDFRNFYIGPCCNVHSEALYVGYSDHGLIENNTFENNGTTSHIFFTWFGNLASPPASNPHDICVRGNTFGATAGAYFDINMRGEINPVASNIRVDPTSNVMPSGVTDSRMLVAC